MKLCLNIKLLHFFRPKSFQNRRSRDEPRERNGSLRRESPRPRSPIFNMDAVLAVVDKKMADGYHRPKPLVTIDNHFAGFARDDGGAILIDDPNRPKVLPRGRRQIMEDEDGSGQLNNGDDGDGNSRSGGASQHGRSDEGDDDDTYRDDTRPTAVGGTPPFSGDGGASD